MNLEKISIADLSDDPQHNIKTVSARTGIRAVTLRAWERRYQLLSPKRAGNQYRRYSEREIALLLWIKTRMEAGLSISAAVGELNALLAKGQWPEVVPAAPEVAPTSLPYSPRVYADRLCDALTQHNEAAAEEVLKTVQAGFSLETVCLEVITPCLTRIGDEWHQGKLRIATEHFASNFLRDRLSQLLQAYPIRRGSPYILTGCAPTEMHEIGVLMLTILLRKQGFRVEYLGQDVPLEDLLDYARYEKPDLILLSASFERTAQLLKNFQQQLASLGKAAPLFGYGGQAFISKAALRQTIPGLYLGEDAVTAVTAIRAVLAERKANQPARVKASA